MIEQMNLNDRQQRSELIQQLLRKRPKELETLLSELYHKRYYEYDIEVDAYYRLVSHVYLNRVRSGKSLMFHMQNFLG